jgi:hypothetical protein
LPAIFWEKGGPRGWVKDWAQEQAIQGYMGLGDQKEVNPKTRQNMQSKSFRKFQELQQKGKQQ